MTSSSGKSGYCERCLQANNIHTFEKCPVKGCTYQFIRNTGGTLHEDYQYVDCFRCPDHPAAELQLLWGTDPNDDNYVPTANDLEIPTPRAGESPGDSTSSTLASGSSADLAQGRIRTLSNESLDPLATDFGAMGFATSSRTGSGTTWFTGANTAPGHTRTLSNESLDPLASDSVAESFAESSRAASGSTSTSKDFYVPTTRKKDIISFKSPVKFKGKRRGEPIESKRDKWRCSSRIHEAQEVPCLEFQSKTYGCTFWTWEFEQKK